MFCAVEHLGKSFYYNREELSPEVNEIYFTELLKK